MWHVISCYVSTFTTRQLTLHAYVSRSLMHPFIFLCIGPSLNYHIILLKHWKTQPSSPSCLIHSNLPKATDLISVHRGELPESSPYFSWLQRYISVRWSSFSVFFPLIDFLFCILSWGRNGISINCWSHRRQGTIFRWEIGYFPTWFRLTDLWPLPWVERCWFVQDLGYDLPLFCFTVDGKSVDIPYHRRNFGWFSGQPLPLLRRTLPWIDPLS